MGVPARRGFFRNEYGVNTTHPYIERQTVNPNEHRDFSPPHPASAPSICISVHVLRLGGTGVLGEPRVAPRGERVPRYGVPMPCVLRIACGGSQCLGCLTPLHHLRYDERMYWLSVIAQVGNREADDPAAQRADIWLLVLITVILIAGFFTVIWLTRKSTHRRAAPPKPPNPQQDSWWNP